MSEVFEVSQKGFYQNLRMVQKLLVKTVLSLEEQRRVAQCLTEAGQEINKMEIQYNLLQDLEMKRKISVLKCQLRNYKKQWNQKQQNAGEKNGQHFFQSQTEENGINPLIAAKRQMYQNEALSNEAAQGIRDNNMRLASNINRLGNINKQLTLSQKLLGSIKRKMRKNTLILRLVAIFVIVAICLIVYTYLA